MTPITYRATRRERPTLLRRWIATLRNNPGALCFWLGVTALMILVNRLEV